MKRLFYVTLFLIFAAAASPCMAERQFLYYGFHYEYAGSVNSRVGFVSDTIRAYWITDCIIPPYLIAKAADYRRDDTRIGSQQKLFATRIGGGAFSYRIPKKGTVGLELSAEALDVIMKINPAEDMHGRDHLSRIAVPAGPGLFHSYFFQSWFNVITAVNVLPVYTREKGDSKLPWRASADVYIHFNIASFFTIYASAGYGYFLRGLPGSAPANKRFGGANVCAGLAF